MNKANIILNGTSIRKPLVEGAVICADGGYNLAVANGIKPNIIIGDFDSIQEYDESIECVRFSSDKDKTDGELAVRYAASKGYKKIHIYGVDGGRLDHILANINLLHVGLKLGVRVTLHSETSTIYLAHSKFELNDISKGDTLSIVPFSSRVHIINTKGLKYEIKDSSLYKGTTRGISNVATEDSVLIDVVEGEALVFKIH